MLSTPEDLDQYGFPLAWHNTPHEEFGAISKRKVVYWQKFVDWCQERGKQAFPAPAEVALDFLQHSSVDGSELYHIWLAISHRYNTIYWHTAPNPVEVLYEKVRVGQDGSIQIEDNIFRFKRWGFTFDGLYQDPSYLQAEEGAYIVLCLMYYTDGNFGPLNMLKVAESENVQAAAVEISSSFTYPNSCIGTIYYAALYKSDEQSISRESLLEVVPRPT